LRNQYETNSVKTGRNHRIAAPTPPDTRAPPAPPAIAANAADALKVLLIKIFASWPQNQRKTIVADSLQD